MGMRSGAGPEDWQSAVEPLQGLQRLGPLPHRMDVSLSRCGGVVVFALGPSSSQPEQNNHPFNQPANQANESIPPSGAAKQSNKASHAPSGAADHGGPGHALGRSRPFRSGLRRPCVDSGAGGLRLLEDYLMGFEESFLDEWSQPARFSMDSLRDCTGYPRSHIVEDFHSVQVGFGVIKINLK